MGDTYHYRGQEFQFNDPVKVIGHFRAEWEGVGRLVQVRLGCGQFGSDEYFIRRNDGSLIVWENVMLTKYDGEIAAPHENDAIGVEYGIKGEWNEIGFIITEPSQPQTPGSFSVLTSPGKTVISM